MSSWTAVRDPLGASLVVACARLRTVVAAEV